MRNWLSTGEHVFRLELKVSRCVLTNMFYIQINPFGLINNLTLLGLIIPSITSWFPTGTEYDKQIIKNIVVAIF